MDDLAREFGLLAADLHRFFGIEDMKDVMLIGHRQMFGKYIAGLPEDSALIRKLRAPYEQKQQAKDNLREQFKSIHG